MNKNAVFDLQNPEMSSRPLGLQQLHYQCNIDDCSGISKMNFTVNLSQVEINTLDQNMHQGSYYPRLTIAISM